MKVPLIGRKFHSHFSETDCNFYVEMEKRGSQLTEAIYGTPGLKTFFDPGIVGEVRALFEIPDRKLYYTVIANKLYAGNSEGAGWELGTLVTFTGPVIIRQNGLQLCLVDGSQGYVYDLTTHEFTTISRETTGEIATVVIGAVGSGYVSVPTVTVAGGDGVDASLSATLKGLSVTLNVTGTGYAKGDTLSLADGTSSDVLKATVDTVIAGVIQAISLLNAGEYSVIPGSTSLVTTTDGDGEGATVDVSWGLADIVINDVGSGYSENLVVTITGGTPTTAATATATLRILNGGFPLNPASIDYIDGYFIVHDRTTGQFTISKSYDGTVWAPLDVASAEGWPDNLLRVYADHRELWLFGTQTTEVWYDSGDTFPFDRISGAYIEYGIGAADSVAKADNSLFWLTDKGLIARANGYTPQIISNRLVEYDISTFERFDDAKAFVYIESGHQMYVLHFPTANRTWVYDVPMDFWHRWSSWPNDGRHRSNCYCWFSNKHLVGDYETGIIYELSHKYFDDDGEEIRGQWTFPPINNDRIWLFHSELEIHMKTGVGLDEEDTDGDGPQAMLQISDDTGITWGNEKWQSIGKLGQYDRRLRWQRLGRSRNRLYRITITDPVERIILGAYVDLTEGMT